MKHKVKKFGRGGDILTALGAGLAGYGAYKYLTKDKDKDDDYTRRVKEYGTKGKFPEEKSEEKAKPESKAREEDSPAKQRALAASKGRPEMGDVDAEADKSLVRTDKKTRPGGGVKRKPAGGSTSNQGKVSTTGVDAGKKVESFTPRSTDSTDKSKSYPIPSKVNEDRKSKSFPTDAERKAKKATVAKAADDKLDEGYEYPGFRKTVRELFPYSDMNNPRGTPEMRARNADPKRAYLHEMAEKGKVREAEKRKAEAAEAEKKRRNRPSSEEMMTQSLGGGFKRGGAVKKYAAGGTTTSKPEPKKAPMPDFAREAKENRERDQRVKKEREAYDKYDKTRLKDQGSFKKGGMTASKRADGIAIRGKTRA
jgi:hypothetical protein